MTALMAHSVGSTKQTIHSSGSIDIITSESEESHQNNICVSIASTSQPQGVVQRISKATYLHYRQTTLWCTNQSGYNKMLPTVPIREESEITSQTHSPQIDITSETETLKDSANNETQINSISIADYKLNLKNRGYYIIYFLVFSNFFSLFKKPLILFLVNILLSHKSLFRLLRMNGSLFVN